MNDRDANITRTIEALASSQPTAPAIHVPSRTSLSYADLGAQIRYVRERLGNWKIGRGDIVAGVIPLRPEMAVACATVPAAATFAPLSPAFTTDVYSELLARLRPKALIVPVDFDHPVRLAARRCGVAEIELVPDSSAPAGMFTLELARQQASLTRKPSSRPDWAYLVTTSGTTGRPKIVPRSHRSLALFAQHLGDWLRFTTDDVGCHLLPMHYGGGLETALMFPLHRGASVVCLPESDIDGFFAALDEYHVTWLAAAPTVHREILRRAPDFPEVVGRSRLRCITVGAGSLKPDEIGAIERTFSAPIVTRYGLTEVSSITADPLPPGLRKRGSVGMPFCHEVAIMSEAGNICATGDVGEIVVRGPPVFEGYFDDAQATAAAFVDGWFRTGDLGRFDEDGYLYLVGRIKEIINRGGEKISPAMIDAAIEAVSGVREAATFAIPHSTLGEEVVAAVVKNGDVAIAESDIIDQVRQRLGPKRVPRQIYFVDQLPRTDSGKVRRSELPRLLGLDQANTAAANELAVALPAPISPLEAALVGLWSSVLQVSSVGVNDDFFLLGGDSLRGAQLLTSVKAVFGVELTIQALFENVATVAGMARAIETVRSITAADERRTNGPRGERLPVENQTIVSDEPAAIGTGRLIIQQTDAIAARGGLTPTTEMLAKQLDYVWTWKGKRSTPESFIVTLNDSGRRPGLFWCLQGYRELTQLAGHLGFDQPVHGMRSGHLVMKYTDENVDAIAAHYATEMIALQPEGPFLLGGNCQGGTIARVIALRLRKLGRTVALLLLMEQGAFPPYEGPVALIFGRDSDLNPYKPGADPDAVFRSAYPAGFTVDIIAGAHGQFFESPNVETLASALKRRLPDPSEAMHPHVPLVS